MNYQLPGLKDFQVVDQRAGIILKHAGIFYHTKIGDIK